ncbi:MAG: reverse transcriptase family protein, partial [Bacteroidota bacterium]
KNCINEDQSGFIKGRYIGENVRLVLDIIDHCNEERLSALILTCDIKQAYDCMDWDYLKRAIASFGFGEAFKKWIKILYDSDPSCAATARVQINGMLSEPYFIERGLRQGCPASCLLFLLGFEPLLQGIRKSRNVKGLTFLDDEVKILAYADDATLVIDGTPRSLKTCLKIFDDFKSVSGLQLNYDKTQAMWIGENAKEKLPIQTDPCISWPTCPIEILGVKICNEPNADTALINYKSKLNPIKRRLNVWNGKSLTPFGRIHLLKSEILSQLVYLLTVLPEPNSEFFKEIETQMFSFVWGGKRDKIKRSTLKSKYKNRGLKFPDLREMARSLKITWVRKFIDRENKAKWKSVMEHKLRINNDTTFFHCNASHKPIDSCVRSKFWRETIAAWMTVKENQEISGSEILNEVLWNNKLVNIEKRKIFHKQNVIDKGLIRVRDIYNISEKRLMSANEVATKFSLHPMNAMVFLRSIPQTWRQKLITEKPTYPHDTDIFEDIKEIHKKSQWAYHKLQNRWPSIPQ